MAKKIKLKIVTPERLVLEELVEQVTLPGSEGELTVLPGHIPLITGLGSGDVVALSGGEYVPMAVSGGFLEVHPDKTVLFAETAELAEEIDAERARQAAERAKSQLTSAGKGPDLAAAEAALRRALIRLRAAERIQRKSKI